MLTAVVPFVLTGNVGHLSPAHPRLTLRQHLPMHLHHRLDLSTSTSDNWAGTICSSRLKRGALPTPFGGDASTRDAKW